jgi:Fe-S-cluster-containing dehydrogenase component/CRP-like cAMP-binding protein
MPQEIQKRAAVLDAIKSVGAIKDITAQHDGHYEHEIDLEVIVYGRNYNGKKVGPYVRLLAYSNGEEVMREGEWGGNTFYVVIEGKADVYIDNAGSQLKVAEVSPGDIVGEMSILAGVPRSATVKAPPTGTVKILEMQRPALRLLRKLPEFGQSLDRSYRHHGRNQMLQILATAQSLPKDVIKLIEQIAVFRVYAKGHVLFRTGERVSRIFVVKTGWIRMSPQQKTSLLGNADLPGANGGPSWDTMSPDSYFGPSHAFGLEGVRQDVAWHHTGVLLGRTEILEISVAELRKNPQLLEALGGALGQLHVDPAQVQPQPSPLTEAQRELISTGLVDGTNLLLMDMEQCVRCGNCSLACHRQHGNSRLLRRGISLTRPEKPKKNAHTQFLLNPSVCMHCMDPECMTGCPTGAIGRFPGGYVDINPATCIGCGDCATQCPYDAISLIPRRSKGQPDPGKLTQFFSIAQPPPPPSVEETDDLVAVKCNLCSNTPMNPPGTHKPRAYSCEENCPTGALLRVNPREYFAEIGNIEGVVFKDETHVVSKHTSHRDPKKRLLHVLGIVLTLALGAGAAAVLFSRYGRQTPLAGGWFNFYWATGISGLLAIVWVMMYPARRQVFRRRVWPLRYWMLTHAYAGVIAGVLLLMHAGARGGGLLTTALMISFDLVILTGLWGIATYYVAPRLLTRIEEQPLLVDDLLARREELTAEIAATVSSVSEPTREAIQRRVIPHFLSFGYLLRQYTARQHLGQMVADARKGFEQAAQSVPPTEKADLLSAVEKAATMRRVDALIYLHRSLKMWLAPHVLTTSLMLALMIVHIVQVVYFAVK